MLLVAAAPAFGDPVSPLSGVTSASDQAPPGAQAPAMRWSDLLSRPKPSPNLHLAYGPQPQQFGELWLPTGARARRTPLVLMIHGGCWTKSVASLEIMNYVAGDLRRRGIAVWNIEYRGVDEPGGGYPGTYQDVGAAIDMARTLAMSHALDLSKPVVVGHSAGGHLALWAAARAKLDHKSPLASKDPLKIAAVVDLAGLADLALNTDTGCGPQPVAAMRGPATRDRPDVYADTSPAALTPLGARQYVIHGSADITVKPAVGDAYAALARAAGDHVEVSNPPGGHVEEIAPGTPSWDATAMLIERLVR